MDEAVAARHSYADLPADVVRRIFAGAGDDDGCVLSVEDRCTRDVSPEPRRPAARTTLGWRCQAFLVRADFPHGCCCRLAGEAACRAWQQALRGLPFQHLSLSRPRKAASTRAAKLQWVIEAKPAAVAATAAHATEQDVLALHSVDCKVSCHEVGVVCSSLA